MSLQVYLEPRVTLVAVPTFLEPEHLSVDWVGDEASGGEQLVEYAGRICYMSQHNPAHRSTKEYLGNILAQGHGSVIEHANYSLLLEGISRSCSHELVRHRAGTAFSQLSQRFVSADATAFVAPPAIVGDAYLLRVFTEECRRAVVDYEEWVRILEARVAPGPMHRKRVREAARWRLPNATETKMIMTGNLRAWRHIITMRAAEGADLEIQRLARAILGVLTCEAPGAFQDFDPDTFSPTYTKV